MTREEAIQIIENLYPADSKFIDTAEVGRELLAKAMANCWWAEPTKVLLEYARLCDRRDNT